MITTAAFVLDLTAAESSHLSNCVPLALPRTHQLTNNKCTSLPLQVARTTATMSQNHTQLKCSILLFILLLSSVDAWIRIPCWKSKKKEEPTTLEEEKFGQTRKEADSGSFRGIIGWFFVKVLGTGKRCLEKQMRFGTSFSRDFGNSTGADAFLDLYGTSQCHIGDVGFVMGAVRAWIVAEAYRKGDQCVARVLSDVVAYQTHFCHIPTFQLEVGGNAEGEAFAVCNEE